MNSPKARLLKDTARCNRIADLLAYPDVEEALLIAFAEYQMRRPRESDTPEAAEFKRQGVVEFMPTFLGIATETVIPKPTPTPRLT